MSGIYRFDILPSLIPWSLFVNVVGRYNFQHIATIVESGAPAASVHRGIHVTQTSSDDPGLEVRPDWNEEGDTPPDGSPEGEVEDVERFLSPDWD
jgi:hypothetical protein